MIKRLLLFGVSLLLVQAATAHRLNEYLEATTISLSRDKVSLELRLTPGVAVAPAILSRIDLNHDDLISPAEQRAYLARLGEDISVRLDGKNTLLKAVRYSFASASEMRKGIGDIIIDYEAAITERVPLHHFELRNAHEKAIAVYLVNCLLPADSTSGVINQTRNIDQSLYQLQFSTAGAPATSAASLEKADHWAALKTYFVHGIRHILTGYDHLLFLCALVLGAAGLWDLIRIVTAFTIAHSITLTLATFGLAHLPEQVVEPVIAASIVFVAIQNIARPRQAGSNLRLAVAFFFGLFHGLGFAGGLLELMHAMPVDRIWYALLGFSLGVEAGNQLVLLPLYGALQWLKPAVTKSAMPAPRFTFKQYASGAVALAGLCYLCIDLFT